MELSIAANVATFGFALFLLLGTRLPALLLNAPWPANDRPRMNLPLLLLMTIAGWHSWLKVESSQQTVWLSIVAGLALGWLMAFLTYRAILALGRHCHDSEKLQ